MTDQEKNTILLAEKVMGWTASNAVVWFWDGPIGARGASGPFKWQPYTSIHDAWMLVDKLRERKMWLKLCAPWSDEPDTPESRNAYAAGFMEFETVDCGTSWVRAYGATPAEAICGAALLKAAANA